MDSIFNTFDKSLYRIGSPVFMGDGTPLTSVSGISQSNLDSGYLTGNTEMVEGNMQSGNFQTGVRGWQIDAEGNAEFNDGTFRGTFILGGTLITVSDIADFQDAIDTVSALGGGTVALTPDTYIGTTNYTVPDNVNIDGNGAVIDFNSGNYQIVAQGASVYQTGTLTATYGSATIVGSGTTWTSGMVGLKILIYDFWYTISAFTDATHLTLSEAFFEITVAARSYTIADPVENISIKNLTVTNSTNSRPVRLLYCNGADIDSVNVEDSTASAGGIVVGYSAAINIINSNVKNCDGGFSVSSTSFLTMNNCATQNTAGTGFAFSTVQNTSIGAISVNDAGGIGVLFSAFCTNLGMLNFAVIKTTLAGVQVSQCTGINLGSGLVTDSATSGLYLDTGVDRCQFNNIVSQNNTLYGINIANANCDRNIFTGCSTLGNGTAPTQDLGTGTLAAAAVNDFS